MRSAVTNMLVSMEMLGHHVYIGNYEFHHLLSRGLSSSKRNHIFLIVEPGVDPYLIYWQLGAWATKYIGNRMEQKISGKLREKQPLTGCISHFQTVFPPSSG